MGTNLQLEILKLKQPRKGSFLCHQKGRDRLTDETVIKYIRQDMVALRETMEKGFQNLEQKMDGMDDSCSQKRADIYERIEKNRRSIEQLDKKFFRLFLIGTGVGFVAGVLATVTITWIIGRLIP